MKELIDQRTQWSQSMNNNNKEFTQPLLDWSSIAFGAYMFRQGPKQQSKRPWDFFNLFYHEKLKWFGDQNPNLIDQTEVRLIWLQNALSEETQHPIQNEPAADTKLFVNNLPSDFNELALRMYFEKVVPVTSCKIITKTKKG